MDHKSINTSSLENYKETCKKRIILCGGILIFLGGIMIVGNGIGIVPRYVSPSAVDFYYGLLTGAIGACMVIAVGFIVKTLLCLRSEDTLRAAYVKEHDERQCAIWQKAAYTGWRVSSIVLLLAALAASYFSIPVALALLCAAAFSGLCVKIAFLLYDKIL